MTVEEATTPQVERPPASVTGPWGWARANLFSTPWNTFLTLVSAAVLVWAVPPALDWLIFNAV